MIFNPKRIWITGASSGLGRALAEYFAADGVFLALSGRDERRLQEVRLACQKKGAQVDIVCLDVTSRDEMEDYGQSLAQSGALDLVIANAGISGGTGATANGEPLDQMHEIFDINVTGVLNTVSAVLPAMLANNKGQIVLMSSLAGFSGWPGSPSYSASKGAVRLYGEALRGSLQNTNIQVNVVCPGFIKTPMTDVNQFPMPFLMNADRAVSIIIKGLQKNRVRIAFPWPTYMIAGLLGLLPGWLGLYLTAKFPTKPMQ